MLKEAQLVELFGQLEGGLRQGVEQGEGRPRVSVKSQMFVALHAALGVAAVGNGEAGEVEGAAAVIRHYLDVVRILRRLVIHGHLEGCHLRLSRPERRQQQFEVRREQHRFVSLDVGVDIPIRPRHHFVDAVRGRGVTGGQGGRYALRLAVLLHFEVFGCHHKVVQQRRSPRMVINPVEHRPARNLAQDFPRQPALIPAGLE